MNKINWPKIDSDHLIVYSNQMLELENDAFKSGMPEASLMEKVGIAISNWLVDRKDLLKNGATIIAGPGHNGGDGVVIARELFLKGFSVRVWSPFAIKKKLTKTHLEYITSLGVKKLVKAPDPNNNDLWIDAIFGNNQFRPLDQSLIELFNRKFDNKNGQIISIDIPSGLCPNSGRPFSDTAIKANHTIAVGLKKIGLIQDDAIPYVGEIHNIDIGFPSKKLADVNKKILVVCENDIDQIKFCLPPKNVGKYKRGRTLLIAGSENYPGASLLAIKGALASGVGYIKTLLPEKIATSIWQIAPEIVVEGVLKSSSSGNSLIYESLVKIDLTQYESIMIGPGIGIEVSDWESSYDFFINFAGTLILDADALNRIAASELGTRFFLKRKFKTFITPHMGEFSRLFPNLKEINNTQLAIKAAEMFNLSLLLKGANSIIADKKIAWQIYKTESDAARAGLGDLLSGFIAGMTALEMASGKNISTESLAKYVFLHSYAALKSVDGSDASSISRKLSKIVREIKVGQLS